MLKSTIPGDLAPKAPWCCVTPALLMRARVSALSPSEADANWYFPLGNKPRCIKRLFCYFGRVGFVFFLNKRQGLAAPGSKRASKGRGGL